MPISVHAWGANSRACLLSFSVSILFRAVGYVYCVNGSATQRFDVSFAA